MKFGGLTSSTTYGPLPIGGFSVDLSNVSASMACFGQDRQRQAEDQRQLAIVGAGEIEPDAALADLLDAGDLAEIGLVVGAALVAQDLHREDHVVDGDRLAVREFRRRVERELDPAPVGRRLDGLGEVAVKREWLIGAALQQRLEDQLAEDRVVKPARRGEAALHDERIEAVEASRRRRR